MGPQNRREGNHPGAMIKDVKALLDNTQNVTHRMAIYSGTRELFKYKIRNKTYISDEQLHAMVLCMYHGIMIEVEGVDGEHISQMCRCTGSQSCCGGDQWNRWVWVKQRPGRRYGVLNWHLQWQL